MAVLTRCAAALTFSGCYVDVGQLQERAAAVGGGRRTMYEDVRWFPGGPGRPRRSYATVMTTLPRACPCSTRRRPSAVSAGRSGRGPV